MLGHLQRSAGAPVPIRRAGQSTHRAAPASSIAKTSLSGASIRLRGATSVFCSDEAGRSSISRSLKTRAHGGEHCGPPTCALTALLHTAFDSGYRQFVRKAGADRLGLRAHGVLSPPTNSTRHSPHKDESGPHENSDTGADCVRVTQSSLYKLRGRFRVEDGECGGGARISGLEMRWGRPERGTRAHSD
ncbi:hypothetical protein B0H10DRAFT_1942934 [Mycena sp. CBHHK59/15]|nr:hypothetical protein B0H10DRAFT_1942934 [Mycena sp. CBHHK59/15]